MLFKEVTVQPLIAIDFSGIENENDIKTIKNVLYDNNLKCIIEDRYTNEDETENVVIIVNDNLMIGEDESILFIKNMYNAMKELEDFLPKVAAALKEGRYGK